MTLTFEEEIIFNEYITLGLSKREMLTLLDNTNPESDYLLTFGKSLAKKLKNE